MATYTSTTPLRWEDAPTVDKLGSMLGDAVRPLFKQWKTADKFDPSQVVVTAAELADAFRFVLIYNSQVKRNWIENVVLPKALDFSQKQKIEEVVFALCEEMRQLVKGWNRSTGDNGELRRRVPTNDKVECLIWQVQSLFY